MRLYQTPNLLKQLYGNYTYARSAPSERKYDIENLLTNFETRSAGNGVKALTDLNGNRASFESCYVTTYAQLKDQVHYPNVMKIEFRFDEEVFVHAVLLV